MCVLNTNSLFIIVSLNHKQWRARSSRVSSGWFAFNGKCLAFLLCFSILVLLIFLLFSSKLSRPCYVILDDKFHFKAALKHYSLNVFAKHIQSLYVISVRPRVSSEPISGKKEWGYGCILKLLCYPSLESIPFTMYFT